MDEYTINDSLKLIERIGLQIVIDWNDTSQREEPIKRGDIITKELNEYECRCMISALQMLVRKKEQDANTSR